MSDPDASLRQVGVFLTGAGSLLFLSSVFANFSRPVLLISNLLFVAGVACLLGIQKGLRLFFRRKHIPATIAIAAGLVCIVVNHGFVGMMVQLTGSFLMFGGFLPVIFARLRKLPVIGPRLRVALPQFVYDMNSDEALPR